DSVCRRKHGSFTQVFMFSRALVTFDLQSIILRLLHPQPGTCAHPHGAICAQITTTCPNPGPSERVASPGGVTNDEVFTFKFNVMVKDGRLSSQFVSAVCSGLSWTHRELACEEDYMEAQRTASLSWQLMFLQSDGQTTSMSIPEAQRWGYSMMATSQRVILRSPFKQPHAEVTMVGTHTLRHQVLPGLVGERAEFESRSFSLGLEGFLLDEATATSRGLSLVHQEGMVKIGVPFGSEGGFRKSLVVENMYKEFYMVPLMYEHVFSLVSDDGHIIDTKHRTFKVLETPLICRPPFSLNSKVSGFEISKDLIPVTASYRLKMSGCLLVVFLSAETISDHQEFTVYLGNIPTNVILEEIWINGQRLLMLGKPQQGLSISPIVHVNSSQAYELQLPFNDPVCMEGGISFSIVKQSSSLWEVGIDHEPLTEQLVVQRGYRLHNDSHRTILEVPVFSVGYTYEVRVHEAKLTGGMKHHMVYCHNWRYRDTGGNADLHIAHGET
ncbi:hypothetical protein XENOCAPTIV_007753, partial [Xenoophorus captivus]